MSDVFSVTATTDGEIYGQRARVRQIVVTTSGSGSPAINVKDGGASGTTKLSMSFLNSDVVAVNIPDNGILFDTSVFLDLTDCTSVTFFLS
tara:strand:+ start:238 stop:510 length:273 start_codon:yes stop_codon:yes gene_type:complete